MEEEGKAEVSLSGDGSAVPERKWQPCGIAEERAAAGLRGQGHAAQGQPWPQVCRPRLPAEHGLGERERRALGREAGRCGKCVQAEPKACCGQSAAFCEAESIAAA